MKKLYFTLCLAAVAAGHLFAVGNRNYTSTEKKDPLHTAEINSWIAEQKPLGFQENKGQVADDKGNLVPFVLFKAETPNLNIWITNTGLTYQFLKLEEDANNNAEQQVGVLEEKNSGEWHRVDMVLKNATIKKENVLTEGDITQGEVNYYLPHCPNGIFNVKTYSKIIIKEIYPGIDWILYTSYSALKHDFIVHPHADPNQIKFIYEDSGKLNVKRNQIHFENKLGEIAEGELLCYQGNESNVITSNYTFKKNETPLYLGAGNIPVTNKKCLSQKAEVISEKNIFSYEIGFNLNNYIKSQSLIIDPQLVWATFYGGNGIDGPMSTEVDANGNVYVTGYVSSTNFPLQNWAGGYNQGILGGNSDIFILRFTNAGALTWATYYGGSFNDLGNYIAIDGNNNVFVTGWTISGNCPLQTWLGGYNQGVKGAGADVLILCFTTTGALTWATYYGASGNEGGNSIACDGANNIYITGYTNGGFPTQTWLGAYNQGVFGGGAFSNDIFILRFTNTGVLTWATYFGGSGSESGYAIDIDTGNNLYLTGNTSGNFPLQIWAGAYNQGVFGGGTWDSFILRFTNIGVLTWATYFGGSGSDEGFSIDMDIGNNLYLTGNTSGNFPLQIWAGAYNQGVFGGGTFDIFLLRFTNTGVLTWATYYGGNGAEYYSTYDNITIDLCENIFIGFNTTSTNIFTFGNTPCEYYDATFNGGTQDIFLVKFSNIGIVKWATYFGGDGYDYREALDLDNAGNLFVAGEWQSVTSSATYPVTDPGGGAYYDATFNGGTDDSYIAKFIPTTPTYAKNQVNTTSCSPCNGSATINLTCSEPNYSYVWSNGSSTLNNTSTTNTITGLCPGNYTVTVTSNCNQTQTATATFVITGTPCETCTLTGQFTKGTVNCTNCGCKEWVMITATGGTSPYSYSWPDGYTNRYKNNLCPGAYTINIKDKNGCSINVNLTAP
ncbi:MAG: SBBP repeat-containing protein [Bacteroidetes bacterium]|nr:SBBP repeat-containing protein [Bacteroidota bacterium]